MDNNLLDFDDFNPIFKATQSLRMSENSLFGPPYPEETRTVRKSDYTPALALPKHKAGILDENCREKEKYREEK